MRMTIKSDGANDEYIDRITREIVSTLNADTDFEASIPATRGASNERGEIISVGTIVIAFITSGAAVALIDALRSYFSRDSSLSISLETDRGKVVINAKNISSTRTSKTISEVEALLARFAVKN